MSFDDDDVLPGDDGLSLDGIDLYLTDDGAGVEIDDDALLVRGDGSDNPFTDEFQERVAAREEARAEYPENDLAQMSVVQEEKRAEENKIAPFHRINPASAVTGILGGQRTVAPGQDPLDVVWWTGADEEACPISIMAYPLDIALAASGDNGVRPFVNIDFGTRDGRATVTVDVGRGIQLTVPGSTAFVRVGLDPGSEISYRIAASIGFYTIVRTTPLTRTLYIDDLAGSGSQALARPAFASGLLFERSAPASQWLLEFVDGSGAVVYSRILQANAYFDTPIQLSNDIVSVTATNQSGSSGSARAIFVLAL